MCTSKSIRSTLKRRGSCASALANLCITSVYQQSGYYSHCRLIDTNSVAVVTCLHDKLQGVRKMKCYTNRILADRNTCLHPSRSCQLPTKNPSLIRKIWIFPPPCTWSGFFRCRSTYEKFVTASTAPIPYSAALTLCHVSNKRRPFWSP